MNNPAHAWIARIKKGDVLRSRKGVLRVVREVSHHHIPFHGIRTCVTFTIRHCSWTGRCYTVLGGNDLVQMGYRPTRAKVSLRRRIDRAIEAEFGKHRPELTCCDVDGIS